MKPSPYSQEWRKVQRRKPPQTLPSEFTMERTYSPMRPSLTNEQREALARCGQTLKRMAREPISSRNITITQLQQEESLLSLLSELP